MLFKNIKKDHWCNVIPYSPDLDRTKATLWELVIKLCKKMICNSKKYSIRNPNYIHSVNWLKKTAINQLMLYIKVNKKKKTIININSCENLIQTLEDVFGDPNKKVISPKTLITLCQYKRPFFRYWPAFHKYKSQNWYNAKAKMKFLLSILSIKLGS